MLDTIKRTSDYEVLSPWPHADAVPLRGITPRLDQLDGKKIGLFANGKRAGPTTLQAVERELKSRYPSIETHWYHCSVFNTPEATTIGKEKFEAWIKGMDGVVLSVGD